MALKTKSAIQLRREKCLRALRSAEKLAASMNPSHAILLALIEMIDEPTITAAVATTLDAYKVGR